MKTVLLSRWCHRFRQRVGCITLKPEGHSEFRSELFVSLKTILALPKDLAESPEIIWIFFKAVMDYANEIRDEILVFNGGSFAKDKELRRDRRSPRSMDLVLQEVLRSLRQQLSSPPAGRRALRSG